jgi:hypothetical protein
MTTTASNKRSHVEKFEDGFVIAAAAGLVYHNWPGL